MGRVYTRDEAVVYMVQNLGVYFYLENYKDGFRYRWNRDTGVIEEIDMQDSQQGWYCSASMPKGNYKILDDTSERSLPEITQGYSVTSARSDFVWAIHNYFDSKGETNKLPEALEKLVAAIFDQVRQWQIDNNKRCNL